MGPGQAPHSHAQLPGGYTDVVDMVSSDLISDAKITKQQIKDTGYIPLRVIDEVLYLGMLEGRQDLSVSDHLRSKISPHVAFRRMQEITISKGDLEVMLGRAFPITDSSFDLNQANMPERNAIGLSVVQGRGGKQQEADEEELEMRDIADTHLWDLDRKNAMGKRVITDKSGAEKELEPARDLLYRTLAMAVEMKATDIHIEAGDSKLQVRYRIDGELVPAIQVPVMLKKAFVAAVKVNSTIDAGAPMGFESGRAAIKCGGKVYDLRIEKNPSAKGQELVIRILDKEADWRLDTLHFSRQNLARIRQTLRTPYGLILITGPTGSGKSTTLFAMLSDLAKPGNKKILTVENPVEYQIKGANQVNVNEKQKQTFASALRSFLRQDPDVIMVGEIRDDEVATIAAQAAETGHLVFSTVHTNDASGSFPRLTGMGLREDLLLSSIELVLGQRLIKRVNPVAWEPHQGLASEILGPIWTQSGLEDMEISAYVQPLPNADPSTLYKGRVPVHEVLMATPEIKELVKNGGIHMEIKKLAREQGMLTMFQDGLLKVGQGLISMESLLMQAKPDDGYIVEQEGMGLGRWSLEQL